MKIWIVATAFLVFCSLLCAQQPAHPAKSAPTVANDTSILVDESANLKADLAQLRALLNVLASQESGTDTRTSAALQTNRQMWQVVIGRLSELSQRVEALEQKRGTTATSPQTTPQH